MLLAAVAAEGPGLAEAKRARTGHGAQRNLNFSTDDEEMVRGLLEGGRQAGAWQMGCCSASAAAAHAAGLPWHRTSSWYAVNEQPGLAYHAPQVSSVSQQSMPDGISSAVCDLWRCLSVRCLLRTQGVVSPAVLCPSSVWPIVH